MSHLKARLNAFSIAQYSAIYFVLRDRNEHAKTFMKSIEYFVLKHSP